MRSTTARRTTASKRSALPRRMATSACRRTCSCQRAFNRPTRPCSTFRPPTRGTRSRAASSISSLSSSSCAAAGRCCIQRTRERSSAASAHGRPGRTRRAICRWRGRRTCSARSTTCKTRPDLDPAVSRITPSAWGRSTADSGCARTAHQGGRLCAGRLALQLPTGNPTGQLHAARDRAGAARQWPR